MARFEQVQQSVAEFCRKEGVSAPSFYPWRKRLAQPPAQAEEAAGFRPVRLVSSAGIAVQLPGGTQLQVPTADRGALRLVIDTLARADAQRAGGGPC
jgi:transposase-like protein